MLSSWDANMAMTHFLPCTTHAAPAALCAQRTVMKCTETSDSNGKEQQTSCLYFSTGFLNSGVPELRALQERQVCECEKS